jgi:hypothetical protein
VRAGSASEATPAAAAAVATPPSRDELVQVWGDGLLAALPNRARARFRVGRFLAVDGETAVFALPNETHRSYCEEVRVEVEAALGARFGTAVPIRLVVDDEAGDESGPSGPARAPRSSSPMSVGTVRAPGIAASAVIADVTGDAGVGGDAGFDADGTPDLLDPEVLAAETEPAGAGPSPQERLKQAFPGAQEV